MAMRTIIEDGTGIVGAISDIKLTDEGKLSEQAVTLLVSVVKSISQRLNGRLTLGTGVTGHRAGNMDGQWITVLTPGVANTEFTVPHGLGRLAVGYLVVDKDRAADIYSFDKGSWDSSIMILKCSVADATVNLWVF